MAPTAFFRRQSEELVGAESARVFEKVSGRESEQGPDIEWHYRNSLETELIFGLKLRPAFKFGLNLQP